MKARFVISALVLGTSLAACNQDHKYSALNSPPPAVAPAPQIQTPAVPQIPATSGVRPERPAKAPPSINIDDPDHRGEYAAWQRQHPDLRTVPTAPYAESGRRAPIEKGVDIDDATRRIEEEDCSNFVRVSRRWSIDVDKRWSKDKAVKARLEAETGAFLAKSLCEDLQTLIRVNHDVATRIKLAIGNREMEIKITDDNWVGDADKHSFHFLWIPKFGVGKPEIKLGRRASEGVIAAIFGAQKARELALPDNQLVWDSSPTNVEDIVDKQIRAARATFFHYAFHLAQPALNKDDHGKNDFRFHRKALDVINACTAQVEPHFSIDAERFDDKGRVISGRFYRNTNLACRVCATAYVDGKGTIRSRFRTAEQETPAKDESERKSVIDLCAKVRDDDSENWREPERAEMLYEEMN